MNKKVINKKNKLEFGPPKTIDKKLTLKTELLKSKMTLLRIAEDADKLLDDVKDKTQQVQLIKLINSIIYNDNERMKFYEVIVKGTIWKRAIRNYKKFKKLGIVVNFVNEKGKQYTIVKYPSILTNTKIYPALSYATDFKRINESVNGFRRSEYKQRMLISQKAKQARDKKMRKEYRQIMDKPRLQRPKASVVWDGLGKKYSLKGDSIRKIVYIRKNGGKT